MGLNAEDDAIVAEIALRRGWVDREALRRALEIQAEASAIELDERLLDILATKGFITDRQARELDEAIGLGRLLGPDHCHDIEGYRVLGKLGQGGMGAVFKAVQLSMKRLVALKVLAPELAADPSYVARFEREARALGRVAHPGVVGGLDSGRSGDYCYYAMEYVEGRNLYEVLGDGPLPVEAVVAIAEQMASALCHIEELGLVHRDIKPSNIILTRDGVAKLCDLGLARAPEDPSVTDTGIPIGTPHYAAPELATGRRDADVRCDIYALGGTLYHLVTGDYPFKAASGASLLEKHMAEPLRPPGTLRRDLPRPLDELICRMMAKNPRHRFQSAQALRDAVEAVRAALAQDERGSQPVAGADLPKVAPPIIVPTRRGGGEPTPLPAVAPAQGAEAAPGPGEAGDEAPARSRWAGVVLWGGVYVTLVSALIVAVVWAVRSRRRAAATRPAAASRVEPSSAAAPAPASEQPASPAEPGAARGRGLAAAALAVEKANPGAHGAALLRLRRAALLVPAGPEAEAVASRLASRRQAASRESQAAYASLAARVSALRERDEFGRALLACSDARRTLRDGPMAERLAADVAKLGAQAERRYLELAKTGGLLLQQRKLEDGLRSYQAIAGLGLVWLQASGERLLVAARLYAEVEGRRLDEQAKRRGLDRRRAAPGKLRGLFDAVRKLAAGREYASALAQCAKGREQFPDGDLGAAVEQLEARVKRLASVWGLLGKNPPQLQGKAFQLYGSEAVVEGITPGDKPTLLVRLKGASSSQPHRRPLRKLPVEQYVQLAAWAQEGAGERERVASAGLIYLSEGKRELARPLLERASALGAAAAPWLRELEAEAVASAGLEAMASKQWASARGRLETALDQYGGTMAVVLDHKRLHGSLRQCVVRLGETPPDGALPPTPLPLELRRVVLLPQTRLSATPPADPVAAYIGRPLERGSPSLLGLDSWRDYTLELEWTPVRGGRFVVLFRVSEPLPGRFTYYYLGFDGERLVLGRSLSAGVTALASCPARALGAAGRHRAVIAAQGAELVADVDRTFRLRASDGSLPRGNVAVAVGDGTLLVHGLTVLFPLGKPRQP